MIVIIHENNRVINAVDYNSKEEISAISRKPSEVLFQLAKLYPQRLIAWCHNNLKEFINETAFQNIFHHKLVMASYEVRKNNYISEKIGYVESSPFINIKKDVTYPTWLMSSCIGGIYAEVLLKFDFDAFKNDSFDYALNSIAKKGMLKGLFCYSSPELLLPNNIKLASYKLSTKTLYKFIKQHYKSQWTYITFFNTIVYDKNIQLLPLLLSWFVSKKRVKPNFEAIEIKSTRSSNVVATADVVIPTIGRKPYLLDVLKDLGNQSLLPKKVIIVEQNPTKGSQSELDYLTTHTWPFKIEHVFTHQTGACNARNLALQKVESDFVFLADDDIRFESNILENAVNAMNNYGLKASTLSCLKEGEKERVRHIMPWHTFGTASSIISSSLIKSIQFDEAFEFGFGEDADFGMQIRNLGVDIGYLPHCSLLHLKAPVGGFRTKFVHPWEKDNILPKPSPTVMLFNLKHQTQFQLLGYKTILFFNFFKLQPNKNVFSYISKMKKRWNRSIYWAQQLIVQNQNQ
jgi:glycosyltransferase involved in cell wall biosynthesis